MILHAFIKIDSMVDFSSRNAVFDFRFQFERFYFQNKRKKKELLGLCIVEF